MPELVHPAQIDPRLVDLERPHDTGATAGLCRALAQRWQVDPIIVRLVTLALTFAGGLGIVLYAWGWLLTPRVGGTPPIMRRLPAFAGWPKNTQAIIVAASTLVVVLSLARQTGVAWGPVIVVGALAWAMARQRSTAENELQPTRDDSSPASRSAGVRGAGESVEQWRARLSPHAGTPLPTVDLYAPEPPRPREAQHAPRSRRSSWWAAAVILVLMGVAAAVPILLGLDPTILWAAVAASGTAGVLVLGYSLTVRSRRLPTALLVLVLVGAVGTGLLIVDHSRPQAAPKVAAMQGATTYTYFGQAPVELDLTMLPPAEAATVSIDATASVVQVRVKEIPGTITVLSETILTESSPPTRSGSTSDLTLIIDGDFSIVEIEAVP